MVLSGRKRWIIPAILLAANSMVYGSRVLVGGIYLATDLINASSSTEFRSYPNTGLYIHNGGTISGVEYGWLSLSVVQKEQIIGVWGANGPQTLELGWEDDGVGWQNAYSANYVPEGVSVEGINVNVPTTDANGKANDNNALADTELQYVAPTAGDPNPVPQGWQVYVDGFKALGINNVYPVYSPNLKGTDPNGNAVDAWLEGGTGSNPFASGAFFGDIREMAMYGGGITIDTPPQQFFHNIPAGTDGQGQAHYQAIVEGEVAWANANNLHSIWIISPSTSGTNYNTIAQQMVQALETNATGSQADIPSEYVVENYGTTTSIETNNPIGTETNPNNELGVALWLAGYEQGRTGDLQLTPTATGSTHLNITNQTATSLAGKNTTVALSATGLQASTYSVALHNTSTNTSDWYIPTLSVVESGQVSDWSVLVMLNGQNITSYFLGSSGFTFNATATIANAGLVMNPNTTQTLSITFTPLNSNAATDPYLFEITGLAHPGAEDPFASIMFVVPEPSLGCDIAMLGLLGLGMRRRRIAA